MSNSKISTVEAISIVLTIFVAHTLVTLPRNLLVSTKSSTIINLIFVSIIAIIFTLIIYKLFKSFGSNDIIDISQYLGGPLFKKVIGIIFISYFIFSASTLLRNFCECLKIVYYPMTSLIFIILAFIIAISIANKFEFETSAKVSLIILPFVLFTILFIFFANFKNFNINNIFPILGDGLFDTFVTGIGNLAAFGGIEILYFLPPYLKEPKDFKKISMYSIGIACIYLLLCVSTLLFMFSFLVEVDEIMPLYSAARYIEFGNFFQRLESSFLLIWIMSITCYLSISLRLSMSIFKKITNIKQEKNLTLVFSFLIFSIALLPKNYAISSFLESSVYHYLVLGIAFVLSFIILLLAHIKKKRLGVSNE